VFGKWKSKMQDDDADLWLDLGFSNHVPHPKPPPIPKVVSILQESDAEDVSTICGTAYHGPRHARRQRSPSYAACFEEKKEEHSEMFGHDLELELDSQQLKSRRFKGSRSTNYLDIDDTSLESIMGPRSCRTTASSKRPMNSLLRRQRQREQYQRFVDSFSVSFNNSEDHKECDDGSSYSSVRRKLTLYLQQNDGPLFDSSQKGSLTLKTNSYSTHTSSTLKAQNRKPEACGTSVPSRRNHRGYVI
jgi:hypothetical protein